MRISKSIGFVVAAFIAGAAGTSWSAPPDATSGLADDVAALQTEVEALKSLLAGVTRLTDPATEQDTLRFTAMNVQVVNGEKDTETATGVGNLIIGYNEALPRPYTSDRSGSHMLVVGIHNQYSGYAGVVVGKYNHTSAPYASVTAGQTNYATGVGASVTGGFGNHAKSDYSSVTGGQSNLAAGLGYSSITGGYGNFADGDYGCSITGGASNAVYGYYATVSGGVLRIAFGNYDWVAGGLFEDF